MPRTELTVATAAGPAAVELSRPPAASALVLLTHGAGAGVQTVDLLAVRDALVAVGVAVGLVTQPYRLAGRGAPPAPARQDPAWSEVVAAVRRRRGLSRVPLVLGGRSNGARVACRTARTTGAGAVVALAFPLHPPGRPDRSRLPELQDAGVPVLVVQGDRDPFGMPPPGDGRRVVVVPRGDHGLKQDPAAVARAVTAFVTSVLGEYKTAHSD
ncbi:alpha/beta family hydrolase [uncultured Jatrophihabitans sp.]|uniref:alpha/beta hydrolase family protein n=1 Tax=uncultured Jatrophihabitans sp. TaxID=1610747 RepID=UPI0035CA3291